MKKFLLFLPAFLILSQTASADNVMRSAQADVLNTHGEKIGHVAIQGENKGVKISLEVTKMTPGEHAFHIHNVGKCDVPDFQTAGGHFNPTNKKHGLQNPEGHHAGDMANIIVAEDGTGKADVVNQDVTLDDGASSLFHPGGTALVIHAKSDDNKSDPAGNAGNRVACGVITKS